MVTIGVSSAKVLEDVEVQLPGRTRQEYSYLGLVQKDIQG